MEMRPRTALLAGLGLGGALALAYLLLPLTLIPGLLMWAWFLSDRPRLPSIAGGLIAFGVVWLALVGRMSLACAADPTCVEPTGLGFWLAIGAVPLAAGLTLLLVFRGRLLHG